MLAEDSRQLLGSALAFRRERKIGSGGVPTVKAPFGLAVSDEEDPPRWTGALRFGHDRCG
jgi:hypothetical protein